MASATRSTAMLEAMAGLLIKGTFSPEASRRWALAQHSPNLLKQIGDLLEVADIA